MNKYVLTLQNEFVDNANSKVAAGQKAYLKDKFEFFGITAPKRKEIQKPFFIETTSSAKA